MMVKSKPVLYSLAFYEGTFKNDSGGFQADATTPFMPLSVGDYIDRSWLPLVNDLKPGQVYQVTAVKHSLQEFGTHFTQHVEVCLKAVPLPEYP